MRTLGPQDIDRITEEASRDIRDLCGIWSSQGPAALDAAVRGDPNFSFAVLDARRADGGAVRLLAMRASRGVLLAFGQTARGERRAIIHGLDPVRGCTLLTDPALTSVVVRGGDDAARSADDRPSGALAAELAWRFDIGVSASAPVPADFNSLPADFAPLSHGDPADHGPPLLAILDAAASILAERTSYLDGLPVIVGQRNRCGLPRMTATSSGSTRWIANATIFTRDTSFGARKPAVPGPGIRN